jgi:hypothetical protein
MIDPKKVLEKLEQVRKEKPFRYLGRRVVQAIAEAASENVLIGQRSAPGKYLAVRLVDAREEKERWEQLFAESRAALLREVEREAAARDVRLRSAAELALVVLTDAEAGRGEAERALSTVLDETEVGAALGRLREEREVILPRRLRILRIESEPPEAAVYLDNRQAGVTPCSIDDLAEGEHLLVLSRPGYLPYEETLRVAPGRPGQRLTCRAELVPEPAMGVLEVRTFPPRARVTIGEETRESPARWRLPAGPVTARVELADFEPQTVTVDLPPTPDDRPYPLQLRLHYTGPERDVVVGRLVVYRPGSFAPRREHEPEPAPNRISSFFREIDRDDREDPDGPPLDDFVVRTLPRTEEPEVLGERPLRRGILLIGREDPHCELVPDIRLFDPENSVSRGCHAWLWIYADTSTGATFNTFLIGNNSPAGIRVDGQLVMETRRLADEAEIEVGSFRMRLEKETPQPRVEFGF